MQLISLKDIDVRYPVDFIAEEIKWPETEERLKKAFQNPELIFKVRQAQEPKVLQKMTDRRLGKGKGPRL
jgi:hypothetical protein